MSADSLGLVREFHTAFGLPDSAAPCVNDKELNRLRVSLLVEELCELAEGLGFKLDVTEVRDDYTPDPVAVLDALTDLQYVLDGAYLQLGFAHVKYAALAEVHRTNMAKLDANGQPIRRADGKITKPEGWLPPDLSGLLGVD